jgi:hypothetical protein
MIDQEKYKKKNVTLRKTSTESEEMSFYELSRWMALIEGVEHVSKKCDQLNIPVSSNTWIKPNALQKYIDERTESMLFEITNNDTI